jgi:hypothetical protein
MRPVDDNDDELRDGESVRVPVFLVDTVRFKDGQPHFVRAVDQPSKSKTVLDLDAARDAARAARESWVKQMCDAWKRPPMLDAAQPDLGTRPEEVMRPDDDGAPDPGDVRAVERRRLTERGTEAQGERDRAWRRYCDNLQNAWKTNPRAATAIERQGERWRGGR